MNNKGADDITSVVIRYGNISFTLTGDEAGKWAKYISSRCGVDELWKWGIESDDISGIQTGTVLGIRDFQTSPSKFLVPKSSIPLKPLKPPKSPKTSKPPKTRSLKKQPNSEMRPKQENYESSDMDFIPPI